MAETRINKCLTGGVRAEDGVNGFPGKCFKMLVAQFHINTAAIKID